MVLFLLPHSLRNFILYFLQSLAEFCIKSLILALSETFLPASLSIFSDFGEKLILFSLQSLILNV